MFRASIIGNLGGDPETRYSSGGTPYLRFNLAANQRVRNESGEWQDRTEWVRCTVFGQRVDSLSGLLKKGMKVYVEGRLEARPWTDSNGNVRAGLELTADTVEFMSPRQSDDRQPAPAGRGPIPSMGNDDADEDLPF